MADRRKERIARNESMFRDLNETLGEHVHKPVRLGDEMSGFVCECADPDCEMIVSLDLYRYEEIRRNSQLFLVAPGHEFLEAERVVERHEGYNVVRKSDEVAYIVEETDPRT
jgi:hypothetical protein